MAVLPAVAAVFLLFFLNRFPALSAPGFPDRHYFSLTAPADKRTFRTYNIMTDRAPSGVNCLKT